MALIVTTRVTRDDAEDYFDYAGYRARNLREPLTRTGYAISHAVNLQFATEGQHLSGGWAPLKPAYDRWKEKRAPGRPKLVLSGQLRAAAISTRAWRVRANTLTYRPKRMKRGNDLVDIHMEGRGDPNAMPARPIFEMTPQFRAEVDEIFRDWLDTLRTRNVRRGPLGAAPLGPDLILPYSV